MISKEVEVINSSNTNEMDYRCLPFTMLFLESRLTAAKIVCSFVRVVNG